MNLAFLSFLETPAFVIPWYAFGALAAAWVVYDTLKVNTAVNPPLKAAWPIIVFFFSVIGLAFYLWTCRPGGVGKFSAEEKKKVHHAYVNDPFTKTVGSVIHCVGGDGLGIVTAMIVLRLMKVSFWVEFWVEYAVGFAFGLFIFQLWAFMLHGNGVWTGLWKAFRAEFFSMITVMLGMGLVMAQVTPRVVGTRPEPDTAAFWGFAALGLLVGSIFTYPVNYVLVRIGWKHGMS